MTGHLHRRDDDDPREEGFHAHVRGPWWIELLWECLVRFGLPTVLAVTLGAVLIWLMTGVAKGMASDVGATKTLLEQHQQQMLNDAQAARDRADREIRLLELLCQNAAKSDAMRVACGGK